MPLTDWKLDMPAALWNSCSLNTEEEVELEPYDLTASPTVLWEERLKSTMVQKSVVPMSPETPLADDKLRCVCISDTHHLQHDRLRKKIPPGDVLIHAGDFTMWGTATEVEDFKLFLESLPHRRKIVIAGNHEITFDTIFYENDGANYSRSKANLDDYLRKNDLNRIHDILAATNVIYLQDSGILICGINFYGSPWQPEFTSMGFNLSRGRELLDKWNLIPPSTDVLITHGPPLGYGDKVAACIRAGCSELLSTVTKRVKPQFHVFGHIHEGHGITTNNTTKFINAAICNTNYMPCQRPIVFDIPLPPGHSKEEIYNHDISPSFDDNFWGVPPLSKPCEADLLI